MKNDRSLVLFPILSTMFAVLAMVAIWAFVITLVIVFRRRRGRRWRLLRSACCRSSQIFRVAIYQYAVTGEAPGGFDRQMLQSAFARR